MPENLAEKIVRNREDVSGVATLKQQLESALAAFENQSILVEQLTNVNAMFKREDVGWKKLFSGEASDKGLTLDDLKDWDDQIREAIAGNPHIGRGLGLRSSYVWEGGMHYENVKSESRGRGGKAGNIQALIDKPVNQVNFFGNDARRQREAALYSQSIVWYIGDNSSKELQPVPIWEITGDYRNPDNDAEIWAYRRSWVRGNENEETIEWYFTDIFWDKKIPYIPIKGGKNEFVHPSKTIFDGKVRGQIGWAYGVPDALSALTWARLYRDFLVNGKIMSDSLATFAFKAAVGNDQAGDNASMRIGNGSTAGSTAIAGVANDLVPISTAGKGYDFDSGRALASVVATALEVSVIALTSDPGTAGSSYGSASTLDLPTRLAIKARRQWHVDFDLRVLKWMGATDARASFDSMDDPADVYRSLQGLAIKWLTGAMTVKELRAELGALSKFVNPDEDAPEGIMLPNNEKSLSRADVDADSKATSASGQPSAASPGQGKSTGAGSGVKSGNTRSKAVNESAQKLLDAVKAMQESIDELDDNESN